MTDNNHPITPPPELVRQWCHEAGDEIKSSPRWFEMVCTRAARWGAAQESDSPEPVAWMYQGEPSFDGTDWRETWDVTTDKRLAEFKAAPDQPIPLFSIQPRHQ